MSQFIMNIDSTYRDRKMYELSTEFGVVVNSTPGRDSASNIYHVNNIIYSKFRWEGNSTTIVDGDTISGNFTDFASQFVVLDAAHYSPIVNFYIGCTFVIDYSGASSVIVFYDPNRNLITLENPIPVSLYDPADTAYRIINPSYTFKNELLLLGSNLFVDLSQDNVNNLFFLKSGPTNSLFVQNVSQGWVLPIARVMDHYRVVTFSQDMPAYENGDLFQIRQSPLALMFKTIASEQKNAVESWELTQVGQGYSLNDVVVLFSTSLPAPWLPAQFRVVSVSPDGAIRQLSLIDPGEGYYAGEYHLKIGTNDTAVMRVMRVASALQVDQSPHDQACDYILYAPFMSMTTLALFTVYSVKGSYIFISNPENMIFPIGDAIELMVYRQTPTGLVVPVVSFKQPVCYDVSLIHLILPNQPVSGYNVLPTFFPYLMLELYNTSCPNNNAGILYTNNPYTEKVAFYCPIGNPKNPLIVSYLIVLSSSQVQTMVWTPTDNLFFRVVLPNGETLRFNFDLDTNEADIISGKITALATANFHFWGQHVDRRVSATFRFTLRQ